MEKRVLIAVFLSFLVIYAFQALVPSPPQPKPAGQPSSPAGSSQRSGSTPAVERQPAPGTPVAQAEPPAPAAAPVVADTEAREIVLENQAVSAVFQTRGAVLKQWTLKHYNENGHRLDLVPHTLPSGTPLPFSLSLDDKSIGSELNAALFKQTSKT